MKTKFALWALCAGVCYFFLHSALAGPSLSVMKPPVVPPALLTGPLVDASAAQGQWFRDAAEKETPRNYEFYDDIGGSPLKCNSISGHVANVVFGPGPMQPILGFTIAATVFNDTGLAGPWSSGSNSHGEILTTTQEQYVGPMVDTMLVAEFAVVDPTKLPAPFQPPYRDRTPYIVADDEDQTAWYCWNPDDDNQEHQPKGDYFVPAWNFGTIPAGQSVTRPLSFSIPGGLLPADSRYAAILASFNGGSDILQNRTTSLKISTWIDDIALDTCVAQEELPLRLSDVSVFHNAETESLLDFGDAPDPTYPTLLANNGAQHVIMPGFFMGSLVDPELDGQPSPNADGDDLNSPVLPPLDDEDGVTFSTALFPGVPNRVQVVASVPAGINAYVSVWIDLNGDGDWSDAGEKVVQENSALTGTQWYPFTPGPITAVGSTFARVRMSTIPIGQTPTGPAPDGEVEDYKIPIAPVKWLQEPDLTSTGVDVAIGSLQLADDFECTLSGPITDLHLWTSFNEDLLPPGGLASLSFTLTLYKDVPAVPGQYSHPGELLWERTFAPGTYAAGLISAGIPEWWHDPLQGSWIFPGDSQVFQYDFTISEEEAFVQTEGTIYWLGVRTSTGEPGPFQLGWKTSTNHWNDDACWWNGENWLELRYGPGHELVGQSMDLAFAVTGIEGEPKELDFGDAPDPSYPTLAANNGASHVIVPGMFLGVLVDAEPDGQPNATATGDDLANLADEDGVTFGQLVPGQPAQITVVASAPGLLDAWIDFANDGSWAEAGDQICASVSLSTGANAITFPVPASTQPGLTTVGRFRFSTAGGLGFTGPAPDGEVEDHAISIAGEADLGDAPDNSNTLGLPMTAYPGVPAHYPTVFIAGSPPHGPNHYNPLAYAWLGGQVTAENEADVFPDADGVNNIQPALDLPDQDGQDDGLSGRLALPHCQWTNLSYWVSTAPVVPFSALFVNVWFDWNRDGDWDDTLRCPDGTLVPEWAVQNQNLLLPLIQNLQTTPLFPSWHPSPEIQPIWMRITLSEQMCPGPAGWGGAGGDGPPLGFQLGETEDYFIEDYENGEERLDFGDAPDPSYPTLLANNGAGHVVVPGIFLGALIDAERDGQPNATATGDDLANLADEDGVTFGTLTPGQQAQMTVTATVAGALDAWIDFGKDGSWAEAGDQICASMPLTAGLNVITFPVPPATPAGITTFGRFRFSTAGGLGFTGLAPDGEVEDYQIQIAEWPIPESDLGDAPDSSNTWGVPMTAYSPGGPGGVLASYPTVFGAGSPPYGPIHNSPLGMAFLGPSVTAEIEADIGPDVDGQNNLVPNFNLSDLDRGDDGVLPPIVLPHCGSATLTYLVTAPAPPAIPLFVNIWFDWNRDGDWNDTLYCPSGTPAPEWAVQNQPLPPGFLPGPQLSLPFTCWHPASGVQPIWMRITLAEQPWPAPGAGLAGGDGPQVGYMFGETEDYYLIEYGVEEQLDFGDAADPAYPTQLASDGARHGVISGFCLGPQLDAEADAWQSPNADGDDANGVDDEDGISFTNHVLIGQSACLDITLTSGAAGGLLDAWMDFDQSGTWDGTEQVLSSYALASGLNSGVCFTVPWGAKLGPTFARFRLSSTGGLLPTGAAQDGEVEDYPITIGQPRNSSGKLEITNIVRTAPARVDVDWADSDTNRHYQLQWTTNLTAVTGQVWSNVGAEVIGPANTQNDTNLPVLKFYRIIMPYTP